MNMLFIKKNYVFFFFFSTLIAQDISGKVVFSYSYSDDEDVINGFGLKRAYLSIDKKISDDLSFKFLTDIDPKSSPQDVYIKNAKVDWKTLNGKVVIGLQGMNMFKIQEGNWGKRYLDKTVMDRFGYSSSADMGVGYYGSNSIFSYSVLLTNGAGYKKSETDSYKKTSLQFVYGNTNLSKSDGFNFGTVLSYEPYKREGEVGIPEEPIGKHEKRVLGIFGAYAKDNLRVGMEWNQLNDSGLLDGNYNDSLTSIYCNYDLESSKNLFLKYDMVSGNKDTNYFLAGLEFNPTKGLMIAPHLRSNDGTSEAGVNFQFKF